MKSISNRHVEKPVSTLRYHFDSIIGNSPAITQIKEWAARVATSHSTVLLTGESGTGKEMFAQAIHTLSPRRNSPFIPVNCAAIPDQLFESEVFGYEAGAFSGAKREGKPGKIELAEGGTLFLDEISELPHAAQGKLLRVLQEREVERLGGTGSKTIDVRILAATNQDLQALVQKGVFRQDLFYRLYVFELNIPALRQRKEDILPLTYHFIKEFNQQLQRSVQLIESALETWLLTQDWPGNIRELKACIERGMNLVQGDTLTLDCIALPRFQQFEYALQPMNSQQKETSTHTFVENSTLHSTSLQRASLQEIVEQAEKVAIQKTLEESGGNRTLAAQKLHIHLSSLYRKIAKYHLE